MKPKQLTKKQRRLISRGSVLALWVCVGLASCALIAGFKLWHAFSAPGFEPHHYIGVAGLAFGIVAFVSSAVALVHTLIGLSRQGASGMDGDD